MASKNRCFLTVSRDYYICITGLIECICYIICYMHMLYNVNGSLRCKLFRGRLGGGREILNPFLQKDTL